jgi:hypothetical protein
MVRRCPHIGDCTTTATIKGADVDGYIHFTGRKYLAQFNNSMVGSAVDEADGTVVEESSDPTKTRI